MSRLRVAGWTFLACGLLLIGFEVALRALGVGREARFRFQSSFPAKAADSLLVAHEQRFFTLASRHRIAPGHAGRYANGDWPFRGRPPLPAPSGMPRVLVVGDSCVFGIGVDASQTLSHQIALELARRGIGLAQIQVLNLGIPGYSVVQIHDLLGEALGELQPLAVVFYVGAWNDQAPAVALSDVELRSKRQGLRGLVRRTALGAALARMVPVDAPVAASHRARVSEHDFAARLASMLDLCQAHGAEPLVIAPAHPVQTAKENPRTRRDAATCLRVAKDASAAFLDAAPILAETALPEAALFLDFVHLAPVSLQALGASAAEALQSQLPALRAVDRAREEGVELEILPSESSTLGDTAARIRASGIDFQSTPFVILVGGAPLVDVRVTGPQEMAGILGANAAGQHEIVFQSADRCLVFPAAVSYRAPTLAIGSNPLRLTLQARPRDRALLVAARRRAESPIWTPQGESLLDRSTLLEQSFRIDCDDAGLAGQDLSALPGGLQENVFVQALVFPCGAAEDLALARWSNLATLEPPR